MVAIASRDNKKKKPRQSSKSRNPTAVINSSFQIRKFRLYIPLPNHLYAEWVKKATDHGKHILCEKPFGLTAEATTKAIEYAKGKAIHVKEAFMYKFHPQWQRVRELVHIGETGELRSVHCTFTVATQSFPWQLVEVVGDSGAIVVELPFNAYPDVPLKVSVSTDIGTRTIFNGSSDQYGELSDPSSRHVLGDADFPVDDEDNVLNMKVLDALFASEKSGTWEQVQQPPSLYLTNEFYWV